MRGKHPEEEGGTILDVFGDRQQRRTNNVPSSDVRGENARRKLIVSLGGVEV